MKTFAAMVTALLLIISPFPALAQEVPGDDIAPSGPRIEATDLLIYTNDPEPQPVSYSVTAEDPLGLAISSLECSPPSGSDFPVEFNQVQCTAINEVGSTTVRTFSLELILDTTPPEITPPPTQTFSTTTFPASPVLALPTATDESGQEVTLAYEPLIFPAGTSTVTWTATDIAGNTAATTSEVVIIDASAPAEEEGFTLTGSVELPNGCSVTDSAGVTHIFPTATTTEYLAICALVEAQENGIIESFAASEFSGFGLFIESINGVSQDGAFWALYHNATSSQVGIGDLALAQGEEVSLILTTFDGEPLDYSVSLSIASLVDTYNNIILPNTCSVMIDEVEHSYPADGSPSDYLGICALVEIQKEGYIDSYELVEFSGFGLFVDSINDVADPDTSFWALYYNGAFEESRGLIILPLAVGDTMSLVYTNFLTNATSTEHSARVIGLAEVTDDEEPQEEEPPENNGGGGGGGGTQHLSFNVPAALAFLSSAQSDDGSFGDTLFTDWVALAFAAADPGAAKTNLRTHLLSAAPAMSSINDYERHAMALMALGIDPYTGTSVDYITPIVSSFDGTQIGSSIVHDDIFAIFPLLRAGYTSSDAIIQKAVAYIVSKQVNGSWGDPDTTAAAVQALTQVNDLPDVSAALTSAQTYLHAAQQADGGFGSSFSTSWAMQAIAALGQSETQWAPGGLYPRDYIATLQESDGGVEPTSAAQSTRVWATAYAIPGALGKTWISLLSRYSKPTNEPSGGGGGGSTTTTATSTATSTATTIASSTPGSVATSTEPVATTTTLIAQTPFVTEPLASIAEDTPEGAYATRIAQVAEPEPIEDTAPIEEPTTESGAVQQLAAATESGADWNFIVLAFLALALFGLAGYIGFVRKYWR